MGGLGAGLLGVRLHGGLKGRLHGRLLEGGLEGWLLHGCLEGHPPGKPTVCEPGWMMHGQVVLGHVLRLWVLVGQVVLGQVLLLWGRVGRSEGMLSLLTREDLDQNLRSGLLTRLLHGWSALSSLFHPLCLRAWSYLGEGDVHVGCSSQPSLTKSVASSLRCSGYFYLLHKKSP